MRSTAAISKSVSTTEVAGSEMTEVSAAAIQRWPVSAGLEADRLAADREETEVDGADAVAMATSSILAAAVDARARVQGRAHYGFSGSPLNSAPKQLRTEVRGAEKPTANHNFGMTAQGPIKIPGIYENPNNRSTFTLTYSGRTGTQLFDQYATVPTETMRAGDFSGASFPLFDPSTGQPFEGNQIPAERMNAQSLALLGYYPLPNLSGDTQNYHYSTSQASKSNQFNVRINHNFSGNAAGGRGGGRGGGGGGGGVAVVVVAAAAFRATRDARARDNASSARART